MALPAVFAVGALWGTISTFVLRILMWVVPWVIHYGLLALGIGTITFLGLDYALQQGIDLVMARYSALPAELVPIIQLLGVTDAISILAGAATACLSLKVTAGMTKFVAKRPAVLKA